MKRLLFLALLPLSAFAEDGVRFSAGAAANLEGQYFPREDSPETRQTFGILNVEASGTMKAGKAFLAKFRPTGHLDPNNPTKAEQSWWDVPEGYVQLRHTIEDVKGTLQVGFNTFTWGVTDGYNPLDVVSARRYSDPLNTEKLGAFSVLGRLDFGFMLAEGIYIPKQRESTLPGDHSRWLPRDIGGDVVQSGTTYHEPPGPQYTFSQPLTYDKAMDQNFGFRLSSHFLGIDAAGYYFNGASSVPGTTFHLTGKITSFDPVTFHVFEVQGDRLITLTEIFNRVRVYGASAVFNVWELVVRGEGAITDNFHNNSSAFPEQTKEAVVELEHTFQGDKSSFTLIALTSWADQRYGDTSTTVTPSLTQLFDRAVGLGVRWAPAETVGVEMGGAFDLKRGGELFKGQLDYKLSDAWKAYLGGDVFDGKSGQPIGVYSKNSRVMAGVKVAI